MRYPDEELIRVIRGRKLLFRRFRLGEFLEARIILEQIEHRIEPEQRFSPALMFASACSGFHALVMLQADEVH